MDRVSLRKREAQAKPQVCMDGHGLYFAAVLGRNSECRSDGIR